MRLIALLATAACTASTALAQPAVRAVRVPDSGIQPQAAVDSEGTLHLLYYKGDPKAGDLFYVSRAQGAAAFTAPIRVNSQPGSAIAIGNDRGGQLAIGKNNRVHIAWNGSSKAEPKGPKSPVFSADNPNNGLPMLYTRQTSKGDAFEPQRNAMSSAFGLDGGGSVAADGDGRVYVVFHADPAGSSGKSETERMVLVASSADDGATFGPERAVSIDSGACGCCGLKALVTGDKGLHILYRSAVDIESRGMVWLHSDASAAAFQGVKVHPWKIKTCPMSTASFADLGQRDGKGPSEVVLAWETEGNVFMQRGAGGGKGQPIAAPGSNRGRKYPSVAADKQGNILLAWTEGMSWNRGGTVHWQLFQRDGKPVEGATGQAGPVPAWSLVAAFAEPDGSFSVLY